MKAAFAFIIILLLSFSVEAQAKRIGLSAYGAATLQYKNKSFIFDVVLKISEHDFFVQWMSDQGEVLGEYYFSNYQQKRKVKIMGQKLSLSDWTKILLAQDDLTCPTQIQNKKARYQALYSWQADQLQNMILLLKKGKIKLTIRYVEQTWQHETTK